MPHHPAAHIRCLAATAAIALLPVATRRPPDAAPCDGGRSVGKLQPALHLGDDGVFGGGTLHAVKHFERQHGLTADGVVGAGPGGCSGAACTATRAPVLRRSAVAAGVRTRGASVRLLQSRLGVAADASSARVPRARCAASSARRLTANGVVGPRPGLARDQRRDPCSSAPTCTEARPGIPLRSCARSGRQPHRRLPVPLGRRPSLLPRLRAMTARARSPTSCTPPGGSVARATRASSCRGASPAADAGSPSTPTPGTPS